MDMPRLRRLKERETASTLRLFSVSSILVCCALSQFTAGFPIQQSVENVESPSKWEAQHEHHQSLVSASKSDAGDAQARSYIKLSIPDLEVIDQHGKKLRFYTDLVKGKVVVINFIYTSCTYVCPLQGASFSRLQTALEDRIGRDVHLISVSTDPDTDTTEKLKAWGEKFGAKKGWRLVTGEKAQMDKLLLALTGDYARKGEHSAIALIGGDDKSLWVRTYGLEGPQRMIQIIDSIVNRPAAGD